MEEIHYLSHSRYAGCGTVVLMVMMFRTGLWGKFGMCDYTYHSSCSVLVFEEGSTCYTYHSSCSILVFEDDAACAPACRHSPAFYYTLKSKIKWKAHIYYIRNHIVVYRIMLNVQSIHSNRGKIWLITSSCAMPNFMKCLLV